MAEISKSPLDLANSIIESNNIIGTEVDVPFQKGIKGKIIDEEGDTYGIEYTTPNGITRKDRFYKNEYNLPGQQEGAEPDVDDLSDVENGRFTAYGHAGLETIRDAKRRNYFVSYEKQESAGDSRYTLLIDKTRNFDGTPKK